MRRRRAETNATPYAQRLIIGGAALVVGALTIVPVVYLLLGTVFPDGALDLSAVSRALGSGSPARSMIINSFIFASGSTLVSMTIGIALAFLIVRTDVPFRGLFTVTALSPIMLPGVLYTLSWTFIADPRIGIVNRVGESLVGIPPLDIYSLPGMIWVQGVHDLPIAFLFMVAAFRSMDPSLEESAFVSGGTKRNVFLQVSLPILRPAMIGAGLLLFVKALESFEVPAMLGPRAGVYVFTSRIFFELRSLPVDYPKAGAYAFVLLAVAAILMVLARRWSRHSRDFQTVVGRAFRAQTIPLGRWRNLIGGIVLVYMFFTLMLPILMLVYASLLPFYQVPSLDAFDHLSLSTFSDALTMPKAQTAFTNSMMLGVGTAVIVMLLTTITAWVAVRSKARGRAVLDVLTVLPLTVPGLVLGLALAFLFLRVPLPIYGTLWILLISYCTQYIPYGQRYASASISQISTELEESAVMSGVSWWTTLRRVVFPLAAKGILAGWIYVFMLSFRELSSSVLLYSPGGEVMSVLIFERYNAGDLTTVAAIGVLMMLMMAGMAGLMYGRLGARLGVGES